MRVTLYYRDSDEAQMIEQRLIKKGVHCNRRPKWPPGSGEYVSFTWNHDCAVEKLDGRYLVVLRRYGEPFLQFEADGVDRKP